MQGTDHAKQPDQGAPRRIQNGAVAGKVDDRNKLRQRAGQAEAPVVGVVAVTEDTPESTGLLERAFDSATVLEKEINTFKVFAQLPTRS